MAAFVLTACLLGGSLAQVSEELTGKIDKAAESQEFQQQAGDTVSQEVVLAPAISLHAGTGDIDTTGPCAEDIVIFCHDVKPGYAHIAECLSNQIEDDQDGTSEFTAQVPKECQQAVLEFKMEMADNINADVQMAAACKQDAAKYCQYTKDMDFPGRVIACLREKKSQLSGKCQQRITLAQIEAAKDYRLDANLYEPCKPDAEKLCADVEPGSGRVNGCLRDKREELTLECQEEMFRADVENADDLRLSARLFSACLGEKRKFCAEVAPGNARAKDCLEEYMDEPGFGDACRDEMAAMIDARARDFRLDVHIRSECAHDIRFLCGHEEGLSATTSNKDGVVVRCLQDLRGELSSEGCKAAVQSSIRRASQNWRFSTKLADTCYADRQTHCVGVQAGSARVIRCLQDARSKLQPECQAALWDHEVLMSESIEFRPEMNAACSDEVARFCDGVPTGDARVIWCLQQHKEESHFGDKCSEEVTHFEKEMSQDYRLNRHLYKACEEDVAQLCHEVCTSYKGACGGQVLRCLTDKRSDIKKQACRQEVFYFVKMEVSDFGNDLLLAEACRNDVDQLCAKVKHGEGRVHECLRENRAKLSPQCRKEELKLEIEEANNFDLQTAIRQTCNTERNVFCGDVVSGQARVFRCLIQNLGAADFGDACRTTIRTKLQRRQQNWKLDPNLRRACSANAAELCADVDHESDKAETLRCLMRRHDELSDSCLSEAARAAHMALYVWVPGSALSNVCDVDINRTCTSKSPKLAETPGKVLSCLEKSIREQQTVGSAKKALSSECKALLDIGEPPDAMEDYNQNLQVLSMQSMQQRLNSAGMWDNRRGVTITGYSALFCFSALCTTLIMALRYGYKQWRGVDDSQYQRVVKVDNT